MEILGVILAIIGGITNASYPIFRKKMSCCTENNAWMLFSFFGFFLLPTICFIAIFNTLMIPMGAYLILLIITGFTFAAGMILFTKSLKHIGLGISFTLNITLNTSLGTLLPLIIFHPNQLLTSEGFLIYFGIIFFIASIILIYKSNDRADKPNEARNKVIGISFGVISGLCTSFQSTAYTYAKQAFSHTPINTATASIFIWFVFFGSCFLCFFGYFLAKSISEKISLKLLNKNNILLAFVMGVFYYVSILIFSYATKYISVPIAWPLFMSSIIITSNFISFKSNELYWAKKDKLLVGYLCILIALTLFSLALNLN